MFRLSEDLYAALRTSSPTLLVRLIVRWPDGSVRATYDLARQVILGGSVRMDRRSGVRGQATLEVDNAGGVLAPALATDELAQGSGVRIEVGAFVAGEPALVPLITGIVGPGTRATMRRPTVSVTVTSHLGACQQEAGEAFQLDRGTPLPDALHALWDPVLPFVEWVVDARASERTIGSDLPVMPTDSRLSMGLRLAQDLGCEAFDDREGRIVVQPRPDPTTAAVARVMATPIDLAREVVRPPVNAQGVEATPGTGAPIFVVVEVDDPASPIHRDRIGLRMAPTVRSDAIPDHDTARATARAWLAARSLAADEVTSSEGIEHLDLDPADVVSREEPVSGAHGRWELQALEVPLGPGSITTVERAVLPLFLTADEFVA